MQIYFSIFSRFLILGCTSFGGPAAHLGYFHKLFVQELKWLSEDDYSQIVALSQILPGPGSSQTGFAIGLHRGGLAGGILAFLGFTLPSFILMAILAVYQSHFTDSSIYTGVVSGLKLLAVIVVADAVISMARTFCQTRLLIGLTIVTTAALLLFPSLWIQLLLLLLMAGVGAIWAQPKVGSSRSVDERINAKSGLITKNAYLSSKLWLVLFLILFSFSLISLAFDYPQLLSIFSQFYQSGSLVFGGGHVVLPLLQQSMGDTISSEQFITGYAAAQGVPGPMFTLATYLGAIVHVDNPWIGALVATLAIFLPGFLLILGVRHQWKEWSKKPLIAGAINGINAAVVGLLAAAFYQPILVNAVDDSFDLLIAIIGLLLLRKNKVPLIYLLLISVIVGVLRTFLAIY
ncbi:chromate efflux transporter [Pleionea sediminis]|uniref:chromate efflux transporter n=1 Tax=Pleionea sediminis TaxID=2569479 RepID=UPI0011851C52|nr:chromate efflux transporter [Pleionea sediminis]